HETAVHQVCASAANFGHQRTEVNVGGFYAVAPNDVQADFFSVLHECIRDALPVELAVIENVNVLCAEAVRPRRSGGALYVVCRVGAEVVDFTAWAIDVRFAFFAGVASTG